MQIIAAIEVADAAFSLAIKAVFGLNANADVSPMAVSGRAYAQNGAGER